MTHGSVTCGFGSLLKGINDSPWLCRWKCPTGTVKNCRRNLGGGLKYFYVHPYFGKIPILTHIFQMGWFNHQPETDLESWPHKSSWSLVFLQLLFALKENVFIPWDPSPLVAMFISSMYSLFVKVSTGLCVTLLTTYLKDFPTLTLLPGLKRKELWSILWVKSLTPGYIHPEKSTSIIHLTFLG